MLEKLKLINWQGHSKIELEFDPLVTVIVGPSDVGKSAIIRGAGFICLNKPAGDQYVKDGEEATTGTIWADGHKVVRKKGRKRSENFYKLDGRVYKSFGQNAVPEDVSDVLNLSPINFQRQLELPFWFTETAGQVSRNLNQIINLGVIDDALASVASELRKSNLTLEIHQNKLKELKQKKEELSWVPKFLKSYRELRELAQTHERIAGKAASLRFLVKSVADHTATKERLAQAVTGGKNVVSAGVVAARVAAQADRLRKLIKTVIEANRDADATVPDVKPLLAERAVADRVAEGRRKLEGLVDSLTKLEAEEWDTRQQLKRIKGALKRNLGRTCPACGQTIVSLPSPSEISTCATSHQSSDQTKTIGMRGKRLT